MGVNLGQNKKWWKAIWGYERHKQLNRDISEVESGLDWIWVSKSIVQLKEAVQALIDEHPKFWGNKIQSYHSIRHDDSAIAEDVSLRKSLKI